MGCLPRFSRAHFPSSSPTDSGRADTRSCPICDDSLTKDLFIDQGWRQQILEREGLYDLVFDPHETHNLVTDSNYREILENLRRRLDQWMRNTGDPLAHGGPVAPPATAVVNDPDALSPSEPHYPAREFLGLNR